MGIEHERGVRVGRDQGVQGTASLGVLLSWRAFRVPGWEAVMCAQDTTGHACVQRRSQTGRAEVLPVSGKACRDGRRGSIS